MVRTAWYAPSKAGILKRPIVNIASEQHAYFKLLLVLALNNTFYFFFLHRIDHEEDVDMNEIRTQLNLSNNNAYGPPHELNRTYSIDSEGQISPLFFPLPSPPPLLQQEEALMFEPLSPPSFFQNGSSPKGQ